ncbi:MAG: hypothetical protein JWO38_2851 [Gemmataceae bacterium]|nr:hypothetical protein [Gemmataceae bacterium]
MSGLNLSNLHVRPNLLSAEHYQQEMMRCSVFELRNINERNPGLVPNPLPVVRQQEWRDSLFWGDSPPPPVAPAWAEHLAGGLSEAVRELEERPTLEAAFECLLLARQLYNTRPDGPARAAAAEWDRRVCVVLARDEFRHTPDMIDQRLESVLGHRLAGPPRPAVQPVEPPARPAVVAVRPRQPILFPATTEVVKAEAVPELPAVLPAPHLAAEVPPSSGLSPPPVEESPPTPTRAEIEPLPAAPMRPVEVRPTPGTPPRPTTTLTVRDPDLKRLVQRWSTLPDHVKKCVMMLLDAAEATQNTTE